MSYKEIVCVFFISLASNCYAVDGKINFSGTIIKTACTFSDVNVELGTYPVTQFPKVGDHSLETTFVLPLTTCPVSNNIPHFRILFEADQVNTDHPNLIQVGNGNVGSDIATGVGIQIMDAATRTVMPLNTSSEMTYPITGANININLLAYYQSYVPQEDITEGEADASVDVTFDYR
ncbi:fimbrial protein [Hafnia paralvei]|uniref:fimbrial protein n=1 Tax=Hafnia paralvei TaxID=546367 RepID=UPI003CFB02FF